MYVRAYAGLVVELYSGAAGLYPEATVGMQGETVSLHRSEVLGLRERPN